MEGGDKEEDIQPKPKKRKWIKPYKGKSRKCCVCASSKPLCVLWGTPLCEYHYR